MEHSTSTITARKSQALHDIHALRDHLNTRIIGQARLLNRLLIALLADGHLLVEGAPGLAKTKAIQALAECIEGDFHRIQFTPDLLPGDITGTEIFRPQQASFSFQQGPIFHNLVLADEINRAPAKVQSALLEAMAERQVTIGRTSYALPALFLVMATQNPIEQEGTYPLPEAQLDRFLMFTRIHYPHADAEKTILQLNRQEMRQQQARPLPSKVSLSQDLIFAARLESLDLHLSPELEEYLVQLIMATREPQAYSDSLAKQIAYGASPRGTIALDRCARAMAWLQGRDFVTPEDIHAIAHDVLRHRILLTYEAEAQRVDVDEVVTTLLNLVPVP